MQAKSIQLAKSIQRKSAVELYKAGIVTRAMRRLSMCKKLLQIEAW